MSCWLNGCPVAAKKASPSSRARKAAISSPVRASFCWIEGRSRRLPAPSSTRAGTMPLTPTEATSASGTSSPTRRMQATAFAHQASGSPSAQPGCGVIRSCAALARATTRPSPSSAMAFTAVVPMSSPSATLTPPPPAPRCPCHTSARRGALHAPRPVSRVALPSAAECPPRSLPRASCPAGSASPDRIDAPVNRIDGWPAECETCRLGAPLALSTTRSPRPGTFAVEARVASKEADHDVAHGQADGGDADHSRNPADLARHIPCPDRGRRHPQRAGPARRARRGRRRRDAPPSTA